MHEGTHVVIIGGGFGGLDAARALARAPVRVTLIDRHNHHVFQPLLYQVATAGLSPGDIASPIRWILAQAANAHVLLAEASSASIRRAERDPARRAADALDYDYLIVAAGATHSYFGHDDWAAARPGLKTLDDALAIRRRVLLAFEAAERETDPAQRRLLTFVIIGGGPTGVELAGALGEIARQALRAEFVAVDPAIARIILLRGGPVDPAVVPRRPARVGRGGPWLGLASTCATGRAVTGSRRGGVGSATSASRRTRFCGPPASPPRRLRDLGVRARSRRPGDRRRPTSAAAGSSRGLRRRRSRALLASDGKPLPGVAQVAKQLGTHAATNVARSAVSGEPTEPFRYLDPGNLATIGRNSAIADFGFLRLSGYLGWLFWLFLHIFFLIGFRNRLSVMLQWAVSLPHLSAQRPADHRARVGVRFAA